MGGTAAMAAATVVATVAAVKAAVTAAVGAAVRAAVWHLRVGPRHVHHRVGGARPDERVGARPVGHPPAGAVDADPPGEG